jgi:hypothetical protein
MVAIAAASAKEANFISKNFDDTESDIIRMRKHIERILLTKDFII